MIIFDKTSPLPDKQHDFSELKLFSRFRRFPGFSEDDCFRIFAQDVNALLQTAVCGAIKLSGNKVSLVVAVSLLPWDSDFFQMRMARLYVWRSELCSGASCAAAIGSVLSLAAEKYGIHHVSMDVDIDDYEVMNIVLSHGFEVMDIKRAYVTNTMEVNAKNEKGLSCVRPYVLADYPSIQLILASISFETRYTRDKSLDPVRAQSVYRVWFESMLKAAGAQSHVVVYEKSGKIVACGAIGELDLSSYGISKKVRTNSIAACSKSGVGAYGAILTRMTLDSLRTHGLIEGVISLNNMAAIRTVEGIRPNRSITSLCLRRFSPQ